MSWVVAAAFPTADAVFGERVRRVVSEDRWDLDSPTGIALMQAVLRTNYPMATVVGNSGVSSGGVRRTVVLDVYRDGTPGGESPAARWTEAVYDMIGPTAYRLAAGILGTGAAAESAVERAFAEVRRTVADGRSLEAGAAAVAAAALRLAREAQLAAHHAPGSTSQIELGKRPTLAVESIRSGARRPALSCHVLARLGGAHRAALELAVLEDLDVATIAERMQTKRAVVHALLRDALRTAGSGAPTSAATTLARWHAVQRDWNALPADDPARAEQARSGAHAWLDHAVAIGAVEPRTVVLVTDIDRRFVAATANAGQAFGRASVIGLRIDDVTAPHLRPLVPQMWEAFESSGSMYGEYDCERPGQYPIRIPFRGV